MLMRSPFRALALSVTVVALLLPLTSALADDPIADVILKSDSVLFQPRVEVETLVLTVNSPCGIVIRKEYDGRDTPTFALEELEVENVDGTYKYRLEQAPFLSREEEELIADLRKNGDENDVARSLTDGKLPKAAPDQTGYFVVLKGAIITDTGAPEKGAEATSAEGITNDLGALDFADEGGLQSLPQADILHNDDVIIFRSLCVGFDCVNGEVFNADTIRLKENNLRIHFEDTSVAAGFPTTDWRLIANDQASGGASYFSIQDASANRRVFTVEANAPSNSLYVDNGGRVGIRTSNPVVDLHISDGDTPTLRLEQTGASGFAPQTWDVAGNETSFFIRDATNGSTLPFRIRPTAASNSLVIDTDSDVGVGTLNPDSSLHVRGTDGDTLIHIEEASGTAATRTMLTLTNNGGVRVNINDNWTISATGGNLNFDSPGGAGGGPGNEAQMQPDGDFAITGDFISGGVTLNVPDYVFEPDYPLMPIGELKTFIIENRHLPNVPNAAETKKEGLNLTSLQLRLLEKIEELTLYTVDQHEQLTSQNAELARLDAENAQLKARLEALEALIQAEAQP